MLHLQRLCVNYVEKLPHIPLLITCVRRIQAVGSMLEGGAIILVGIIVLDGLEIAEMAEFVSKSSKNIDLLAQNQIILSW